MSVNEAIEWRANSFDGDIRDVVIEALSIYGKDYKRIAEHIKNTADSLYGACHHCIVGKDFHG